MTIENHRVPASSMEKLRTSIQSCPLTSTNTKWYVLMCMLVYHTTHTHTCMHTYMHSHLCIPHHTTANYGTKEFIKYKIFCSSNLTSDQSLSCCPRVTKEASLNTLIVIFLVPGMTLTLKICQLAIFPHTIYVLLLVDNEVLSHSADSWSQPSQAWFNCAFFSFCLCK